MLQRESTEAPGKSEVLATTELLVSANS